MSTLIVDWEIEMIICDFVWLKRLSGVPERDKCVG